MSDTSMDHDKALTTLRLHLPQKNDRLYGDSDLPQNRDPWSDNDKLTPEPLQTLLHLGVWEFGVGRFRAISQFDSQSSCKALRAYIACNRHDQGFTANEHPEVLA